METSAPVLEPAQIGRQSRFEFNLEALRGFAALVVVLGHAAYHQFSLDPAYSPSYFWVSAFPGHNCVLLFFILSGYVIGLTNTRPLTRQTIGTYLRKRLVRLYPIYLACLVLTAFALQRHYSPLTLVGHALFLQNGAVPLLYENNPLWSLNNEVLYYLLFIPVSYFGLRPGWVCLATLLLAVVCSTVLPMPLLSSYALGFVFWTAGLWLAQSTVFRQGNASRPLLYALGLLFIAYSTLNPFVTAVIVLVSKLPMKLPTTGGPGIALSDLVHLPFCFFLFLRFANRTFRGERLFALLVVLSGACYALHIYHKYSLHSPEFTNILLPIAFLAVGTVLLGLAYLRGARPADTLLPAPLLKLGAVSYGIYVVHFPLSLLLSYVPFFSGSALTFLVRLALDLLLVLAAGYLLELKFQPWVKARLS